MTLLNRIREFFCKPLIKQVTRFLHIRAFMKNLYYHLLPLSLPKTQRKRLSFYGIKAIFQVNTTKDIKLVETPLLDSSADGEKCVLKQLLNYLKSGDVVYDIGANVGVHTIFMAKRVGEEGRVFAFEPESQTYEMLLKNIKLNNLNNVIPLKLALGSNMGESFLYSGINEGSTFNLIKFGDKINQKIKIIRGDFLVKDKSLPLPNVVKIDVEGYEYKVLKGLEETL